MKMDIVVFKSKKKIIRTFLCFGLLNFLKGSTINDLGGAGEKPRKKISKALLQEKKISRGLPGKNFF